MPKMKLAYHARHDRRRHCGRAGGLGAAAGRGAAAQVAALDHVAGGFLRLHDRRLDGEDRRAGARRRIHRHRAALYLPDRRHEGGDERRRRDRLHRRHRHDPVPRARRRLQGLQADQAGARAHLVRLSDGVDDGDVGQERRQVQVLEGFQRQAGVLHPGRLP